MNGYIYQGLFGLCLGDAMGVPYEFRTKREMLFHPAKEEMSGYGSHNQPAGTWSDDTSMTLCLADSLAETWPLLDYRDIMQRFERWLYQADYTAGQKVFDCGNSCRESISRFKFRDPVLCGGIQGRDNGNGSLMRILPLAFYIRKKYPDMEIGEEQMKLVAKVSSLTHRHPRSIVACGIYICAALEIMRTGCLKEGIQKGVQKAFSFYERDPKYGGQLEHFSEIQNPEKLAKRPAVEIIGKGYVVDTLKTALWSLMRSESFKDAILNCINCGYDTDTTAAVAGGLAGLVYPLPGDWLQTIQNRELVSEVCRNLERALQ